MTGSAKNRQSCKPKFYSMSKIIKFCNFFEHVVLIEERVTRKTWIASYSLTQEDFKNLCSRQKDTSVVGVCLCPLKAIVHDQSSSLNLPLYVVKKGDKRKYLMQQSIPFLTANRIAQVSTPHVISFVSYNCFLLLCKSIFLLLLLCRAVMPACEAETLPKHTFG